jgi:SAM-dependent methyltransferase
MMTLLRRLRRRGVLGTLRALMERLEEHIMEWYFEARLGVSTAGHVPSARAPGSPPSEWGAYDPSRYGDIRRILRALALRPGVDVFVDVGAGKGRVLVMAARLPIARVVGVEQSESLSAIAHRNIDATSRHFACPQVEVVTADAESFEFPDDATVVYFANPFGEDVLDAVLERVRRTLMRAPRPLRLVSYGPDPLGPFERRIRACDWLRVESEVPLYRANRAWIYATCLGARNPHQLPAAGAGEGQA